MKKDILIFETNKDVLKFLKSFFRERPDYSARFVREDRDTLKKAIEKKMPDALILSSPDGLKHIEPLKVSCPIIAIVSANITRGIRSVVESDVECYLLSPFHKDDLESKLRAAVSEKRLYEKIYKEKKDLQAVIDLLYLISSTLDPKELLYLIVKKIAEIIKVTRCSIIGINAFNQRFADVVSTFEDPNITNLKIDLKKYPEIRKALSSKKPIIVKDARKDPLMKGVKDVIATVGVRSIVVIPVIFRDEVIGTLLLRTSRAGHTFTKREIKLCVALANASANTLYNAYMYERLGKEKTRLEKLAITDYLTGIYNIRYFYNRLEEEFSRAERYRLPLSCIMFDIDYFKKINDTYGHRIGDFIIREFAQLVKAHTRKSDVFARYGGEEFILLLPQTPVKGAIAEAERLRKAVKEHQFDAVKEKIGITASMGIACSPDKDIRNYEDLINLVDNALFTAKNKGRDQVVIHSSRE